MREETGVIIIVLLLFGIVAVPMLAKAGFTGATTSQLNVQTQANYYSLGLLGIILLLGFIFLVFKFRGPDFSTADRGKPKMLYSPIDDIDRIKDYIQYAKSKRMKKQEIKQNLQHAGWEADLIGKAFESFEEK